jgi:hypothetical protein
MRKHVGMHVTALWAKGSDFFLFSFEYFKCLLLFTLCFSGAYSRRNSIALPSLIVAAQRPATANEFIKLNFLVRA